jgi:hypothetical protein
MYVKNEEEFPCPVCNSFSVQNVCEVSLVPTKEQFFVHQIQKMHNILCAGSVLVFALRCKEIHVICGHLIKLILRIKDFFDRK